MTAAGNNLELEQGDRRQVAIDPGQLKRKEKRLREEITKFRAADRVSRNQVHERNRTSDGFSKQPLPLAKGE
jgi:hypothetical protein